MEYTPHLVLHTQEAIVFAQQKRFETLVNKIRQCWLTVTGCCGSEPLTRLLTIIIILYLPLAGAGG